MTVKKRVLISGGSGLIGRTITEILLSNGYEVGWLTRKPASDANVAQFAWNPAGLSMDEAAIHWPDFIINLAGESIGETKWTTAGKKKILESRVQSVETLVKYASLRKTPLEGFVGVSGIGFYGPSQNPKNENDLPGTDFPAQVAAAWEQGYSKIDHSMAEKKAILRLAVVLSSVGGALPLMMQPIRFGVGSVLGSGKQPFSWIHREDAALAIVEALHWDGIFNIASPELTDNKGVTKIMAQALKMPILLPPVPAFALRILLGERADLVLTGTNPNVQKMLDTGFKLQFPELKSALLDLLDRKI